MMYYLSSENLQNISQVIIRLPKPTRGWVLLYELFFKDE